MQLGLVVTAVAAVPAWIVEIETAARATVVESTPAAFSLEVGVVVP